MTLRTLLRSLPLAAALVAAGTLVSTPAHAQKKTSFTLVAHLSWEQASKLVSISPSSVYPPAAGKASGTVKVKIRVSDTGEVTVLSASGPSVFQQAAKDNAKAYRFNPYTINGNPHEFETTITIHYAPAK